MDGLKPELENLTCSLTLVEAGDVVFITSDGVSDNFDPVVGKFVMAVDQNAAKQAQNAAKEAERQAHTRPPVAPSGGNYVRQRGTSLPSKKNFSRSQKNRQKQQSQRPVVLRSASQPAVHGRCDVTQQAPPTKGE